VLDTTLCEKVFQWLAAGRWFSPPIKLTSTKTNPTLTPYIRSGPAWPWLNGSLICICKESNRCQLELNKDPLPWHNIFDNTWGRSVVFSWNSVPFTSESVQHIIIELWKERLNSDVQQSKFFELQILITPLVSSNSSNTY
jgi:hypothetical protein